MCRMLGYVGPRLPLGRLLVEPVHSLVVQSYRPREMVSGTVSADGFGAALWLDDGEPEPAVYRTALPVWADPNLGWMSKRIAVRAALAAVRGATPEVGYELSSVQPFALGRVAFVHNGFISGFRNGAQRALRRDLGKVAYELLTGGSDSETIFAVVIDEIERGAPSLGAALRGAVLRVEAVCRELSTSAVLSAIVGDGDRLVGCRWSHNAAPASLYTGTLPLGGPGACLSSEPLDSGETGRSAFDPVPVGSLVELRPGERPIVERIAGSP
jgi:predicted glutamine amidotransferase